MDTNRSGTYPGLLGEIESRFYLVITLAIFFPTLIYVFFKFAGETEQNASSVMLNFSSSLVFYVLDYVLLQCLKSRLRNLNLLKWVNRAMLLAVATFIPPMFFLTISKALHLNTFSILYLMSSLYVVMATPAIIFVFILFTNSDTHFMDDTNRKILGYLTEKDKASEAAVINETFNDFGVSKEEYVQRLKSLQTKDFVRYEHPFDNGAFIYITESGRSAVKPLSQRIWEYLTGHFLEILILLTALLTLWATLKSLSGTL